MFTEASIDAMVEADRDAAVEQLHLPYKHPSNTLTTIPRAIRRLTRSGRSTVKQIERFLLKAGVQGRACSSLGCIVAEWLASLGFRVRVTHAYVRELAPEGTDVEGVCYPVPVCLTEFIRRFDAYAVDKRLYPGSNQCVQSKS